MDKILSELQSIRLEFSSWATARRAALLPKLGQKRMKAKEIEEAHSLLLFQFAFPDTPENLAASGAALKRVLKLARGAATGSRLANTGICGTHCTYSFTFQLLDWLAQQCRKDLKFDWKDDSWEEKFDDFLQSAVLKVTADAALNAHMSTQELVQLYSRRAPLGEVGWFVDEVKSRINPDTVLDCAFEGMEVPVHWEVRNKHESLGGLRLTTRDPFFVKEQLRQLDLQVELGRALPRWTRLRGYSAKVVIDRARWALALRGRETDPVTHANPSEVYLCELERGMDVALFTLKPERRLPIESYIGYVAARSGVPIAYGGAWLFGPRAEIGLNVFDAFRGGESAFLFVQLMRVYAQLFGARQFIVPPYQLGDDNEEGLHSGAYWFYYRLGFRPESLKLQRLAEAETNRRKSNTSYRSSTRVLKQLAAAPVYWMSNSSERRMNLDVALLGTAVGRLIGERFAGSQAQAELDSLKWLKGVTGLARGAQISTHSLRYFAPLVAGLKAVARWSPEERAGLARIMRLKRGGDEREFVLAVQSHRRFVESLDKLARSQA
ncbi:MAG: hypothetical protein K1X79_07045 [Oligoflexia bacterium]|nr:hypothetical protein [Oligoflexia bacterium]